MSLSSRWKKEELVYNDEPEQWHDPKQFMNMQDCVDKFKEHVNKNSSIAIFADRDMDGIGAGAILSSILQDIGIPHYTHVPHRNEKYGLQPKHIVDFHEKGIDLLITVDNGCNAFQALKMAKDIGINIIITDHHNLQDGERYDFPMISPHDGRYPCPYLCGGVMALKFGQVLLDEYHFPKDYWKRYLDYACLTTIGDSMPLLGENRWIVKQGLSKMNTNPSLPIKQMIDKSNYITKGQIDEKTIGWSIVPPITATGRVDHPKLGYDFLMNEKKDDFSFYEVVSEKQKEKISHTNDDKLSEIECVLSDIGYAIVQGFPEGVLNLIANKLAEKNNRPFIVLQRDKDNETVIGSARSRREYDLYAFIMSLPSMYFDARGGHREAVGFTIYDEFLNQFVQEVKQAKVESESVLVYHYDIAVNAIQDSIMDDIEKNKPYGMKYPMPRYVLRNVKIEGIRKYGNKTYAYAWEDANSIPVVFGQALDKNDFKKNVDLLFEFDRSKKGDIRCNVVDWRLSV